MAASNCTSRRARPHSESTVRRRLRIEIIQSEIIARLESYRNPQFETEAVVSRKVVPFPKRTRIDPKRKGALR
jgi:hypothetical protein